MYKFKFYGADLHVPGDSKLFLLKPVINMGANQSWTVSAEIMDWHPNFLKLKTLKYGLEVYKNDRLISRCRLIEFERTFNNKYKLFAEDKLAALNDSPCRPYEFAGSPEDLFDWFIENHNTQVSDEQKLLKGRVTVTDPNGYITRSWDKTASTWSLMNSRLIDTLGGFLIIRYEADGDYLDWITENDLVYSKQKIEFGKNLTDMYDLIDATSTYTACIPYGAEIIVDVYEEINQEYDNWKADTYFQKPGLYYILIEHESTFNSLLAAGTPVYKITGQENSGERLTIASVNANNDYLVNEEMAAEYGVIYAPTDLVTWDDVTRPENLLAKARNWLNFEGITLMESMEFSAVDLAVTDTDINSFEMYEKVYIESEPHNINALYLVSEMKVAADLSEVLKITVGDTKRALSVKLSQNSKNNSDIRQRVEVIEKSYINKENMADLVPEDGKDGEDAVLLYIDSSRGNAFKNNEVETTLTVMLYKGAKQITDIGMLHEEFGATAYLEWQWLRLGENQIGTIVSTDSRIGNDGFTFQLTPDDVDTKVVFDCVLHTDD